MKIEKNTVPALHIRIFDANGKLIEEPRQPMAYLHGGYGNTLPKIEKAVEGQEPGFQVSLRLEPQDAFGLRDESLERTIAKSEFPPGVKVGGQLDGYGDDGSVLRFTVVKVKGDKVLLDANHPLAGRALRFAIKVVSVRAASDEEIAHGHAHGAHGHHH